MNRKFLTCIALIFIVSIFTVAIAQATPLEEKNNNKFQTFNVLGTFSLMSYFTGDHTYIPSTDNVKKMIIEFDENMFTYDITIGSNTYHLGEDFTYTGHATMVYFDPVFGLPAPYTMLYPSGSRGQYHAMIDYCFDFSTSTIDGTINMQCVANGGGMYINSLSATGDLQNVQIKAEVTGNTFDPQTNIITIFHEGMVSGWPE